MQVNGGFGLAAAICVGVGAWIPFGLVLTSVLAKPAYQQGQGPGLNCPGDEVVRVNTRTGIYHLQGERWFGRTKQGSMSARRRRTSRVSGRRRTENK